MVSFLWDCEVWAGTWAPRNVRRASTIGVRSGVHGSGVLAVTVDSGNADAPIIDIKPANKTARTTRRDAPCCATPVPPHTDLLIRQAAARAMTRHSPPRMSAAMVASHPRACSVSCMLRCENTSSTKNDIY